MDRLKHKLMNSERRKTRIRAAVSGTKERPRLSVFISNTHVSAQIIDDQAKKTLVSITSAGKKPTATGDMTAKAAWAGAEIAKKAKAVKVKRVVLDRRGRLYHGRLKVLAESARKEGLEF